MNTQSHDLVIIGGGPGGYVAAIRAAQLGLNVACVDDNPVLGGTCLRIGCIPSKALLESSERFWHAHQELPIHGIKPGRVKLDLGAMHQRKEKVVQTLTEGIEFLFKKNKIARYIGRGEIEDADHVLVHTADEEENVRLETTYLIIATGSVPGSLPGIELDGDRIGTSTEAIAYPEIPPRLIVIGAGYIGLELGSVWNRLGSKVHVLEYLDRILPGMDAQIAEEARRCIQKQGIQLHLGVKVTGARVEDDVCKVEVEGDETFTAERVLVSVGRTPNTQGIGLERIGIELDAKGGIPVDEQYQTTVAGVFAIGDVIRGPMLAHKAEEEGMACVEGIVTGHGHVNYEAIPAVCYTHPEIAAVGPTEEDLKEAGIPYRSGVFSLRGNGRAHSLADTDGMVKLLAHAETDQILAGHILGPTAGEMIGEIVAAIEFGASSEDLARTSHAHPTLSEAIKEAALAVAGRAIHA